MRYIVVTLGILAAATARAQDPATRLTDAQTLEASGDSVGAVLAYFDLASEPDASPERSEAADVLRVPISHDR